MATFHQDILEGLKQSPKGLPSRFLYDKEGDKLFSCIMRSDDYYLTDSEHEIFNTRKKELAEAFEEFNEPFDMLEFGAGDGLKTAVLLKELVNRGTDFRYMPNDISANVLQVLEEKLAAEIPDLYVQSLNYEYFEALEELNKTTDRPKVVLFLGSNLGNFKMDQANEFLSALSNHMRKNDLFLIGLDLKKDPRVIAKAYNDSEGFTRRFNLNILERINKEMDADFDTGNFVHYPIYDPTSGTAYSYLVSTCEQQVNFGSLNGQVRFEKWEALHIEISQKYDAKSIDKLAVDNGFTRENNFLDKKQYFVDSLWRKS